MVEGLKMLERLGLPPLRGLAFLATHLLLDYAAVGCFLVQSLGRC